MARKSSKKAERLNANDVEWGGFIDLRITDEEKEAFHRYFESSVADMWIDFAECVAEGLKYGLSYDKVGDFWTATFTGYGFELIGMNERYCLTARAPEWQEAVALLVFKHVHIAQKDWSDYLPKTQRLQRFG